MKKTYIYPATNLLKIRTVQMIAASGVTFDGDGNGRAGLNGGTASGDAFGRGGSLWDDDED